MQPQKTPAAAGATKKQFWYADIRSYDVVDMDRNSLLDLIWEMKHDVNTLLLNNTPTANR